MESFSDGGRYHAVLAAGRDLKTSSNGESEADAIAPLEQCHWVDAHRYLLGVESGKRMEAPYLSRLTRHPTLYRVGARGIHDTPPGIRRQTRHALVL